MSAIRNITAHCNYVSPEDRVRMGKNHIIASTQPGWFSENPKSFPAAVATFGEDVERQTDPNKLMMDNGVICAYGSDYPVNTAYSLASMQVAMTRKVVKLDKIYELYKELEPAMPEKCISLKEALKAIQ